MDRPQFARVSDELSMRVDVESHLGSVEVSRGNPTLRLEVRQGGGAQDCDQRHGGAEKVPGGPGPTPDEGWATFDGYPVHLVPGLLEGHHDRARQRLPGRG